MRKITLALTLVVCFNFVFSNPVDTTTAKKVAVNFWKQNNAGPVVNGKTLRFQRETPDFRLLPTDTLFSGFYIFNAVNGKGFVIVSANDNTIPILGYSMDKSFQVENMPPNLKDWLNGYEQQIQRADMFRCSDETHSDWGMLLAGEPLPVKNTTNVTPLLTTNWDQGWPYNLSCPYDYDAEDNTLTGCVATAMAQVLKYWEYPQIGVGSHTYMDPNYGMQSANFETIILWNEILDTYDASTYTMMQASAISSLMYKCGVSVDMSYGPDLTGGSSAYLIDNGISSFPCAKNALQTYFDYSDNVEGVSCSDYTNAQWVSMLKNELDSGRVILYRGTGTNGGHAFVCDGYTSNNYFYFNWGWSGNCNGAFSLSALNTPSGDFTASQQAVIHISPTNQTAHPTYDLSMYGTLTTSDTSYSFGANHPVAINCAVANTGNATFNGYLVAIVSDINGNVVAEIPSAYTTITPNHYVNKNFTVQGGLPLGPGVYYVFITSTTNQNDPTTSRIVKDNVNNINFASFSIHYAADIETYSDFYLSEEPVYSGHSLTVNVSPANVTSSAFSGSVQVALVSLTGSYVQSIDYLTFTTPVPAMSYYTGGIDFTGTITAPAGDYFLTLLYKPQGSSNWVYAGSTYYQNPVRITIHDAPIADIYESNNTISSAYSLTPVFTNDVAEVNTNGANFHNSTDVDYFKIVLPSGYEYGIIPVLQDYYYNDDITYSVDAKFYYAVNNTTSWIGPIDLDGNIIEYIQNQYLPTLSDGGTIYFKVEPTFQGEIGTYSLHVELFRQINPDQYEPNNTASLAYNLGTVNTGSANYSVNANFHLTTDNDYYKVILPPDYSYTINANLSDSYNNSNYTADAKFATSQDGTNWSSNYGSNMPALTFTNGGVIYFRVLPYTDHETGTYQLQISITRQGGVTPDMYEPNNTVSTAYLLASVDETETSLDAEATFHISSDVDYYKINLPPDYTYLVDVALFDHANEPSSYTVDAKIAVSTDFGNTWSSYYGSTIPTMTFEHSGRPYYKVVPQQDGSTGTYRLHIDVSRMTGVSDFEEKLSVYPNPTNGKVMIQAPDSWLIDQVDIMTTSGEMVKSLSGDVRSFCVSELSRGLYLLRIHTSNGIVYQKLIKQ